MLGRRKDDRPWLMLRAARISGPDGSVQEVELSGPTEDVLRALRMVIRGVGGTGQERFEVEGELPPGVEERL